MKGIYILIIKLSRKTAIRIGAIGKLSFTKGLYAYVGSAQTNLEKRVERHLRKKKHRFWHIDYLLENPAARILRIFTKQTSKEGECETAKRVSEHGDSVVGFGCSDCSCRSHLFRIESRTFFEKFLQEMNFETMHLRRKNTVATYA